MSNICIFGDSITWGAVDKAEGGWAQRLKKFIDNNTDEYETYSLGVSGDTTINLLKRFEIESQARNPEIIILAIGTNDSAYINEINNTVIPLDLFEKNIKELINLARKFTQQIVIIGLPKVDESKVQPFRDSSTGKQYANNNLKKYSDKLAEISRENQLIFIDVFNILSVEDLGDGLHPNENGHKKLYEYIKNKLIENKVIIPRSS
jgi:acyl-CoA thioesterase I